MAKSDNLAWTQTFDPTKKTCLQYGIDDRRNHVLIVTHENPFSVQRKSSKFTNSVRNVKFTFKWVTRRRERKNLEREIRGTRKYSNVIFQMCSHRSCPQCQVARDLRRILVQRHVFDFDGHYQYRTRNAFYISTNEKIISSRTVVNGDGWKEYIVHLVRRRRIINSKKPKIIILTGGHGLPNGQSIFDDYSLEERKFFDEDRRLVLKLGQGSETNKIRFEVKDLKSFQKDVVKLVNYIVKEKFDFIVLAFCHSHYSNLKKTLNNVHNIKYLVILLCMYDDENFFATADALRNPLLRRKGDNIKYLVILLLSGMRNICNIRKKKVAGVLIGCDEENCVLQRRNWIQRWNF